MHLCYLECWQVLFLLLSLMHSVCLCHLSNVTPSPSSLTFFFLRHFVWVLFSYTSKMIPSILQEGQPKCLFLRWHFCCRAWFREAFLLVWYLWISLLKSHFQISLLFCFGIFIPIYPCSFPSLVFSIVIAISLPVLLAKFPIQVLYFYSSS